MLECNDFLTVSGCVDEEFSKKCEIYSVQMNRWTALPDLKVQRYSHAMTSRADRYLYCFGGFDAGDNDLNSIE